MASTVPTLDENLRAALERTVRRAREVAEAGARAALEALAVHEPRPFAHLRHSERDLRVRLRARARQLGDPRKTNGACAIEHLVAECAYEHWHRMLFARFLAENDLLVHPEIGAPVTLDECAALAAEEGAPNGWALASRYAARMLPQIFRPDAPVLEVMFAPEHRAALERLLEGLPAAVFTARDSLGWVYQFWQASQKDAVNAQGVKIGADELPAVTQLFTEPYMVRFLLHNTLGAWWAGRVLAAQPELARTAADEETLRRACALDGYAWTYLRFVRDEATGAWRPAAGTFDRWPACARELRVLDPCCGSGHFLVEAFEVLVRLRMAEEGCDAAAACAAVLRDNLFGLDLDARVTEIAAFALALAAWTFPGAGGARPLPELHLACSGVAPRAPKDAWLALAGDDARLRGALARLHDLFAQAPLLGSLLDPRRMGATAEAPADLFDASFEAVRPLLEARLREEDARDERGAARREQGVAAQGMAKAAALLAGSYTLVATNVPYLARGKQCPALRAFCEENYPDAKQDLATVFLERCRALASPGGACALVLPQNWLFLRSYRKLRQRLLGEATWHVVARLGPGAFATITGEVVKAILLGLSAGAPSETHAFAGLDVEAERTPAAKAAALRAAPPRVLSQAAQRQNPDARILLQERWTGPLLAAYASALQGVSPADLPRYGRMFWELPRVGEPWTFWQGSPSRTQLYDGKSKVLNMGPAFRAAVQRGAAYVRGERAWGKPALVINAIGELPVSISTGHPNDTNIAVLLPHDPANLPALWCYCSSPEYARAVREIDQKLNVTNATLVQVPFDLARWQAEAAARYPQGLPAPYSDDPTQWLFHGHPMPCAFGPAEAPPWPHPHAPPRGEVTPEGALLALQVAVARLCGYRWPAEDDQGIALSEEARAWVERARALDSLADRDGIVCLPAVRGEQPAARRLETLLQRAFGPVWSVDLQDRLLAAVGCAGWTLERWLRDRFFAQHCKLFGQRPFVWHIWDGLHQGGFGALVLYHRLDRKRLEALTFDVLGDWIRRQTHALGRGEDGAAQRVDAARALQDKLRRILEGEPPCDIFVRWKPLHEQPIGWEPDLDDGVRVNIRPFLLVGDVGNKGAGVLRHRPNIKWSTDRGVDPPEAPWYDLGPSYGLRQGARVNDHHLTNQAKRAARRRHREDAS